MILKSFLLFFLFQLTTCLCAFGRPLYVEKINEVKKNIKIQKNKIKDLKKGLSSINQKIIRFERGEDEFDDDIENIGNIVKVIHDESNDLKTSLDRQIKTCKRVIAGLILSKIDANEPEALVTEFILLKQLKSKVLELKEIRRENKKVLTSVGQIDKKISFLENENKRIGKLEKKKNRILKKILEERERLAGLSINLSRILKKRYGKGQGLDEDTKKKISQVKKAFLTDDFKMKVKPDGVVYSYQKKKMEVRAPFDFIVDYNGKIPGAGHILVARHGKNIRSVFLGNFDSKHKAKTVIKKGDVFAYTNFEGPLTTGKIYYEVRVNKNILPTKLWQ